VSFVDGRRIAWPDVVEAALVIAAIAILFPWFERVAPEDAGRDRRFAEAAVTVRGLPAPALPSLCSAYGGRAEPLVRERLCRHAHYVGAADLTKLPAALTDTRRRVRTAFLAPLKETEARLADLRLQQREGLGDLLVLSNAIEATEAELQPFVNRYVLDGPEGTGPTPLECAFDKTEGVLARGASAGEAPFGDLTRANALLLLGAAIDGHPATPALADVALLSADPARERGRCGAWRLPDALAQASVLMADARQAPATSAKNEAMRGLLRTAGWQWAGWMVLGFGVVHLARRSISPAFGIALSLAAWAFAAWVGRVPWPLASDRGFVAGREAAWWLSMPAPFVLWLFGAALFVLLAARPVSKRLAAGPETMASRIGYPGLVVLTGIGFVLLLDLSAHGTRATAISPSITRVISGSAC
jgi:hypothetical protein